MTPQEAFDVLREAGILAMESGWNGPHPSGTVAVNVPEEGLVYLTVSEHAKFPLTDRQLEAVQVRMRMDR